MGGKVLFCRGWKSNYKMLLIFAAVLTMYITLIISMFDPELGSALEMFAQAMPEMMAMFGMAKASDTLVAFIANYLYGMLLIVFPMIFIVMISNRLVTRHTDRGSMVYLLTAGKSRRQLILIQMSVLISNIVVFWLYCTVLGFVCSVLMFPGELDTAAYMRLNAGLLCLQLCIGGFCFMVSCIFNESKNALLLSAGVPVLAILIQMLANMGESLEKLKYVTPLTLFSTDDLISGAAFGAVGSVILLAVGLLGFLIGAGIFEKKDLMI